MPEPEHAPIRLSLEFFCVSTVAESKLSEAAPEP
jgi:hypothetical protein